MKKVLDKIKKYDIDVIIMIIIIISASALFLKMNWYDELWNFANSYKMFKGYKIYRELNVIITPLFFYIAQVFLKLFGATILSFKIYNICISTIMLVLIYKIFKNLNIIRKRAVIYTLLITIILLGIIKAGANYNLLIFIPILLNILIILKNKENDVLIGILLFLAFMIKQNVFLFFGIGVLIHKVITSKNIKDAIISLIKIYMISGLGIGIFIIYLYFDNNLYNFINYCFLGLIEFGSENIIGTLFDAKYIYISIIIIVFLLFIIKNKKIKENLKEETIKNIKVFLSFGIPLIFMAYPIFNFYHSTLGSLVLIIGFIYAIEEIIISDLLKNTKKDVTVYKIIIVIWLLYSIYAIVYMAYTLGSSNYYFETTHPFFGYITTEEERDDINIICNYIRECNNNGLDVKILSYKANLYMIPLGKNNGIFDLANLGNLGKNGEDGLINEIKNLEHTVILIQTEKDKIIVGQESEKARHYIVENFEKVGEIQEYSIYKMGD